MNDMDLEILHDHCKESFSHIRSWENTRDRHFLVVISLIGVLFVQIQYPHAFFGALGSVSIQTTEIDLSAIPLAALLSLNWTFLLAFVIRYYKATITIEWQYKYLHQLENKISAHFSDPEVYCREGKAYLNNYPQFTSWVWFFYTILFPIILIVAVIAFGKFELQYLSYPIFHKIYDAVIALGTLTSIISYRFVPLFSKHDDKTPS